jgi:outer membrane protein assembly factor BamB
MTDHSKSPMRTGHVARGFLIAALTVTGVGSLAAPLLAEDVEEEKPATEKNPKKKAEQKTEKATDKPPPKNQVLQPLTELFRRKKKDKDAPAQKALPVPSVTAGKKSTRSAIDGRAPTEKRADDLMRKALAAISDGKWNDALEFLQRIATLPEDTLYRQDGNHAGGQWISMHDEAQRLIGEAPSEPLSQYRAQYGGLARQLLADAGRSGDPADFARLARTYFHTDAGYEAANRIGSLHLDRDEVSLAARWFAALWRARPALTQPPVWRAKAALVLTQAGQVELARTIFDVSANDAPAAASALAGGSRTAVRWLASSPRLAELVEGPLTEWPMFFGTPRRTGVAAGGEPLLLPRWRVAMTDRQPVQAQIEHLLDDLVDQGSHPLPLVFPTMIGGKVVIRTFHGVQVVDAETGQPLWQTDELQPLEKLIAATGGQLESAYGGQGFFPRPMMRGVRLANGGMSHGGLGENMPLCHLLFRNANFGLTSSDGHRLFVVDDPLFFTHRQPGYPANWVDASGTVGNMATRLSVYDLETGRPLWEVGGPSNGESFDPPLAGYFFFGAPVADGDDLFVIGESTSGETNKQIRLICLDPETGTVKWTQLVASADPDIEKDLCRRWWTAQVAVADGMVICPTTVGWTVAVDRLTHTLLWGRRAAVAPRPNPNAFGGDGEIANLVPLWQLKDAWGPAPPVVHAGRVVFTSSEAQNFVCLDQATGKELWSKPRGTALFFAGVHDKLAIVVGRDQVSAWQIETGAEAWPSVKIPAPSGRGVMVADQFYQPVAAGEIWMIRLQTGEVTGKLVLPENASAAGNLAMYHGMLLSADALGLTAFEQREAVQNEIERRRLQDPRDPWALIREAQIKVLGHDLPAALAAVRQVPRERVPQELRETFRELLAGALAANIREDLSRPSADADLADLETVVATAVERQNLRRLKADLFLARGQFERAFEIYLSIAGESSLLVARDDAPAVEVRSDLWAAGKIAEMLPRLSSADRSAIDLRVAALQAEAAGSETAQLRFVTLFRDWPQAAQVRRDLAEKYAGRGELVPAEHLLLQLANGGEPAVAAAAVERLARLMLEFKLPADAAAYYLDLERRFAEVPFDTQTTGANLVQALRDTGKFPESPVDALDWHADAIRVERHGVGGFSNFVTQELTTPGPAAPFFASHRLEVEPSSQRLDVIDGFNDEMYWSVPLRSRSGNPDGGIAVARAASHQLTVLHQGVLHGLSPVDRQVLWTKPIENRGPVPNTFGRNLNILASLQTPANLAGRSAGLQSQAIYPAALCVANRQIVGTLGRRSLTVLDSLTGEVAWTQSGLRPGTIVLGGEQVVYIRPPDGKNALVVRAIDGKRIETKSLSEPLNKFLHLVNDQFVMSGLAGGKVGLRLFDPVAGRDSWSMPLHQQAKISILDGDRAALIEPDGKFGLIDLQTGQRKSLATIPAEDWNPRTESFVVADHTNLFLLLNKDPPTSSFSDQVPFIRASGAILAFDLESGKQRWKQVVQHQNLLLERLSASPFLLFSNREYKTKGRLPMWSLHLEALDKLTGARLLDEKTISQPGFRSITVSAAERYVELRSYNERLRLYPADKPASAGQSGGD